MYMLRISVGYQCQNFAIWVTSNDGSDEKSKKNIN